MACSCGVGLRSRYRWRDVCRLVVPDAEEYVEGRVEVMRARLRKAEEGWLPPALGCLGVRHGDGNGRSLTGSVWVAQAAG
ncbi:hypothetical protein CORC01_08552 [Colletotrichum orchidophilum]|uniref:Uncharacterized protein n=1 Tax=Colletotrichum orchidophilum TaxID=1209926 RepID=A0A1G4B4D6_9PEZI|nr:uncharacterized protein CORC01_08552 [Colletotrichum orchidophilum]OHE96175.1 hypothetical protein CORC01_08552 [Colletotrichum orchidophilum]